MKFTDPGDQPRGRRTRKPDVKAPEPASLFDITDQAPPTPMRVASGTSIDTAKEIREETKAKRRHLVFKTVRGAPNGLARFQIAAALGLQDHWISSSVDALIKQVKIEEHKTRTIENPASGKQCAVLVAIEAAKESAA
jgi:hypothetical protein